MRYRPTLITLAVLAAMGPAQAQTAADRVTVTGSMIKRTDAETASPVNVIRREEIERSGATSIDELLRMDSVTGAGGLNDMDAGSGFSSGTASVSLRGLGSAATLLLVNGRRLAPTSVVDPNTGQSTIFNVNSIPVSAIERIEILKDGASSLYGSDAMAGVVNIILRTDYQGRLVELSARQRVADGLFKSHTATLMAGRGDLAKDGYNVFGGIDLFQRNGVLISEAPDLVRQDLFEPLYARLATTSTSSYPGNLYTYNNGLTGSFRSMMPNCAAENQIATSATNAALQCKYNLDASSAQYSADQTRAAGFLRGSWQLNPATTLNGELLASRVESSYVEQPTARTETLSQWGDALGNPVVFNGLALPGTHPDNPTRLATTANPVVMRVNTSTFTFTRPTVLGLRYRFEDVPGSRMTRDDNLRLVLGTTTTLGAWDLDAGLLHHVQKTTRLRTGSLSLSGLNAALASGSYRFGGVNSADVIAGISRDTVDRGESKTSSLDARGSRTLGRLDGGTMMLGVGSEFRQESFAVQADPELAKGDVIGRGIGQASGRRNISAAYAELQLPFVKGLETQAALRGEHYSDFGSAVTGKLGAKYKLTPTLAVRGTFATGFRAPSLSQISNSTVFAFGTVQDKVLCPVVTSSNENCTRRISSVIQANTALEPEESKSTTLGVLFEPIRNAEIVLDAWYFDRTGEVDRLTAQQVVDRESEFPGAVVRLPSGTPGVLGPIGQVLRSYRNMSVTRVGGFDFETSYRWTLGEGQRIKLSFNGTRTLTRKEQTEASQPLRETLGFYGNPRIKSRLRLDWSQGPWSAGLTGNYAGRFQSYSVTGACPAELPAAGRSDLCTIAPWKTADASVVYKGFKNLRLSATLRNLADSKPPFDPTEADTGINHSHANVYGRYLSVTASYEF